MVLKFGACLSTPFKQGSTGVLRVNSLVCKFKFVIILL